MKKSEKLQKTWDDLTETDEALERLEEISWARCTTGYNNDGSTGLEIFKNGFRFAERAAGKETWIVMGEGTAYFFAGSEEDVEAALRAAAKDT